MSLPPATVKIKRKATDDPVEFLRIHEAGGSGKRQRQESGYIFSRQPFDDSIASQNTSSVERKIKPLQQTASSTVLESAGITRTSQGNNQPPQGAVKFLQTSSDTPSSTSSAPNPSLDAQPRRFHISRSVASSNSRSAASGGPRKRKAETVFVERRIRPRSVDGTPVATKSTRKEVADGQKNHTSEPIQAANGHDGQTQSQRLKLPQQKKPGKNSRPSTPPVRSASPVKPAVAPLRNVVMPSGNTIPWDVTSDRLAAEMQAYTLQEIGKSLAVSEASRPKPVPTRINKSPSKFKPKKPALRYSERHPEEKVDMSMDIDGEYLDEEMEDDSEYIIDTYVRIPADALETEEGHKNIGLLVLDSQPDIDEFYKEEEDSDEEDDIDDEDENAENHYTADYPDEEVDSDDEFNRNAYNYRTHNASDLEEYDEDDPTFSDDDESSKYPWNKKPWMKKTGGTILDDDDV